MARPPPVIKSGWLYHKGDGLFSKWKKRWFVMFEGGYLSYYKDEKSPVEKDRILIYAAVLRIYSGEECHFSPPDGVSPKYLLMLEMRNRDVVRICCEDPLEMRAWQTLLEGALAMSPQSTGTNGPQSIMVPDPRAGGYGGMVLSTGQQQQSNVSTTVGPGGTQVVTVRPQVQYLAQEARNRYVYRHGRRYIAEEPPQIYYH